MTDTYTPQPVRPVHAELPPYAYAISDDDDLAAVAAALGLTIVSPDGIRAEATIPLERRYNLASSARVGDVIVQHPVSVRDLETLHQSRFAQQYTDIADGPTIDDAVRAEVPGATAAMIVGDTPDGVVMLPVFGIVSPSHAVGLAHIIANRVGGRA